MNRSIDKAIELFNKIATKCNFSEKLSELETKAPMEISTPQHKLSNGDIRKKLSNYYKLKQTELFTL